MMSFRFLLIAGFMLIFAGAAQADPKWRDHDRGRDRDYERDYDRQYRYDREKDYRFERDDRRDGHHSKHENKHYKDERKAAKKHYKEERKAAHKRYKEYQKLHRHYKRDHHSLPEWAHKCGLPPGLAKRHKIPRRWEKRCRSGQRYYENRHEFRQDIYYEYPAVYDDQPSYQTIYEMDAADCKVYALRSSGNVAEGVALGAVFGGLIGAAGGAIIESARRGGDAGTGAVSGAIGGAVGGAVLGGIIASSGYERDFRQCMTRRGHWR